MAYTPTSGKKGAFYITGDDTQTFLCLDVWTWRAEANIIDAPSMCSSPYNSVVDGLLKATITGEGTWDKEANPFVGPPEIKIGRTYTIELVIDENGLDLTAEGTFLCRFWEVKDDVKDRVTYSFEFVSTGEFQDFSGTPA